MGRIKIKIFYLVIISLYLVANTSCTKHTSSTFQGIDTIRYEAILDYGSRDWCVTGVYPINIGTDTNFVPTNVFGECNQFQNNVEATFYMKKYTNNYIYLSIYGYNQWPNVPPYPDSAITLNIFLNGNLVATQTAKTKDSLRYIIY
jgi:hypothetical protein